MKTRLAILILMLVAVLVAAAPAGAKSPRPVGEQISVAIDFQEFPAGEDFYISHGWFGDPGKDVKYLMMSGFALDVDGVPREKDFVSHTTSPGPEPRLIVSWVYNFPGGMTGVHTFTGHWLWPCQSAVEAGWWTEDCPEDDPNALVVTHTRSTTVTFTE